MYLGSPLGLASESYRIVGTQMRTNDHGGLLRPETLESLYWGFQSTHKIKYVRDLSSPHIQFQVSKLRLAHR